MLIASIIIFLLLTAVFAGAEIAFISASKLRIQLKRESGSSRGEILAKFYEKPSTFIGTMLVGINITLVTVTSLATEFLKPLLEPFIHEELFLFSSITVIITVFILLFGEFIPKVLFKTYADEILYYLAYPLLFVMKLLSPITWIMTVLAKKLLRLFTNVSDVNEEQGFTSLDLENFVRNSVTESEEEIDSQLFENALYLKEVKVKACMVPRSEITFVDVNEPIEVLLKEFTETKLSKILICEEDLDNVLGYVHHHQMLRKPKSIRAALMNIAIIPETMRVDQLLQVFKQKRSIACVVDEFGSTVGVITLEDILEQIFGDIEDEYDEEEYIEEIISEKEYVFSGRLEINYLNEKYKPFIEFPEDSDYSTLSGYIVMTTGEIPEQGTTLELDAYKFIFESVSNKKIETVRVVRMYSDI
jgi:CBS domain containing-hemolysin-like protein